jgi:hypothetical protein
MQYSVVEDRSWRFLMTSAPSDKSIKKDIPIFEKEHVHNIVRCVSCIMYDGDDLSFVD